MEHKLIMENWRKAVKEASLTTKAIDVASGAADGMSVNDMNDIVSIFAKNIAELLGIAARNPSNRTLTMGGGLGKMDPRRARFYRRVHQELSRSNLLGKLKVFAKEPRRWDYIIQRIGKGAVIKGLARVLPPIAIALEIHDIISLWNRETKGVNTWGLALDAIKGSHAMAKDNPGHEEAVRYTTENFDKWDEETQVGWCVKHGDAPKDFEGQLTCQTVLQKADPKLIQKAKTTQGKGSAGKTDADTPMSVPTS